MQFGKMMQKNGNDINAKQASGEQMSLLIICYLHINRQLFILSCVCVCVCKYCIVEVIIIHSDCNMFANTVYMTFIFHLSLSVYLTPFDFSLHLAPFLRVSASDVAPASHLLLYTLFFLSKYCHSSHMSFAFRCFH